MKRIGLMIPVLLVSALFVLTSAKQDEATMTKQGTTTVINTKKIGKSIEGYNGTTPVKIYIKKNKVEKVEALPNQETPKYFMRAKKILDSWNGMTVNKAIKAKVDGVTGATYSSDALIENVQKGLKYYKEHK